LCREAEGRRGVIEVNNLSKRFGTRLALDDVSFRVEPGRVTAFLGPNGSGKTTTMRILLGLEAATSGSTLIDGAPYASLRDPMCRVGALLDARGAHPGRSAFHHLRALALTHGVDAARVDDVLDRVGLADVANHRVGGFSLGMRQRLGIAGAMLGDPSTYVFDEPINGLDPDGVRWFRNLVREFASDGRTVFLSSHLISEVELSADHVIVLGRGRVLADSPLSDFGGGGSTRARSVRSVALAERLREEGAVVVIDGDTVIANGISTSRVGDIAADAGIPLSELVLHQPPLEDAYRALTEDSLDYKPGSR
jgi:ABC-2 type transport system ATP-binding protein